jgi:predicted kinase
MVVIIVVVDGRIKRLCGAMRVRCFLARRRLHGRGCWKRGKKCIEEFDVVELLGFC